MKNTTNQTKQEQYDALVADLVNSIIASEDVMKSDSWRQYDREVALSIANEVKNFDWNTSK